MKKERKHLYSHRDESENGLKRGEKKEHNNHVLLLKAYLLLLFTLTGKCLSFLTDKYLSKIAIFTGITLDIREFLFLYTYIIALLQ